MTINYSILLYDQVLPRIILRPDYNKPPLQHVWGQYVYLAIVFGPQGIDAGVLPASRNLCMPGSILLRRRIAVLPALRRACACITLLLIHILLIKLFRFLDGFVYLILQSTISFSSFFVLVLNDLRMNAFRYQNTILNITYSNKLLSVTLFGSF